MVQRPHRPRTNDLDAAERRTATSAEWRRSRPVGDQARTNRPRRGDRLDHPSGMPVLRWSGGAKLEHRLRRGLEG